MTTPHLRRILLAIDGSVHADQAAEYLSQYAIALGRHETIVLHVVETERFADRTRGVCATPAELGVHASRRTRRILDKANISYRLDTKVGDPAEAIAEAVANHGADEVIMGSRGLSQWEGLFVGSVAYKTIHRISVPITIVGTPGQESNLSPNTTAEVHRVLLAIDGSAHSVRAAEYVFTLHEIGVPLQVHIVNVVVPIPPGFVTSFVSPDMIASYYKDEGTRALHDASAGLKSEGVEFAEHIVAGHAADEIVRLASECRCSRIIMGTRGLRALAGIMLGSVAYRVIQLSPVPVTLVK